MNKKFVEIDDITFRRLERLVAENGFSSVDELLTAFAQNFSAGCSVTLTKDPTQKSVA